MAVKKVGSFNIHETPAINQNEFDVETYLNANWEKTKEAVNNNAEELMQAQKDISTLKEDNKTNKSSIDVLEKSNETRDGKITLNKESIKEIQAENERLRNDIKSIAVVNEVSGENIHVEDSSEARCELEICGNHQQETREGYNQININDFFEGTRNGVTITKDLEKGSLTFNGTVTSTFAISIPLNLSKGTIISYSLNNSKVNKEVIMRLGIANGQIGGLLCNVVNAKKENFELTEDINEVQIRIGAGITLESFVVFPQLETNTSLHNFEIYGASPSMNFPSKLKSVGNDVNLLNPNTFNNVKGTSINDEKILIDTTSNTSNANLVVYNNISLEDDTYSIIAVLESGKYTGGNIVVRNADGQTIGEFSLNDGKKIVTGNIKDIVLWNVTNATNCILKIKISKGKETKGYSKFGMGSAKTDISNKNYLSKIPKKSIIAQGITSTFDGEKFICKGTAQINYFNLFTAKVYKKIGKGIKTLSTNKLKKGRVFIHFDYVDGTGQNYYTSKSTNQVSFTLNKDVKSYILNVDSITAGDTIDDNIYVQLEDGNIATEIEKAENQEYLIDVQQEMLEGDTFVRQDGKWYEKHNWITLLNENIINNIDGIKDESKKTITTSINLTETPAERSAISNILTYANNWNDTEHMIFSASLNTIYCLYNKDRFSELNYETIKKEIGEFSGIIKYKSNKSTYLECTEAQSKVLDEIYSKAHTYKNITNISAESSEVNPIVSLKYLKDVETEHNKLQAQINEIKQLLSTTETSAMLLNNMQTDLESEV